MNPVTLDSSGERFLVSIDKNYINKDFLMEMLERIRIEYLAHKIDFSEEIEELGEEIKDSWWKENKNKFISED
jgi:hypothetical protein